jgi:hypothetical protein
MGAARDLMKTLKSIFRNPPDVREIEEHLAWRWKRQAVLRDLCLALSVFVVPLATIIFFYAVDWLSDSETWIDNVLVPCVFSELAAITGFTVSRARAHELEEDLRRERYRYKISHSQEGTAAERRARSQQYYFLTQAESRQYHQAALRQSSRAFVLGMACVVVGLVALGGAIALAFGSNRLEGSARTAAVVAGFISAIVTNLIAGVLMRLHGRAMDAVKDFHGALASVQALAFGVVIAAEMEKPDEAVRTIFERGVGPHPPGTNEEERQP